MEAPTPARNRNRKAFYRIYESKQSETQRDLFNRLRAVFLRDCKRFSYNIGKSSAWYYDDRRQNNENCQSSYMRRFE